MYIPKHFLPPPSLPLREGEEHSPFTLEAMRQYNFATIVSTQSNGEPIASHVPVVLEEGEPLRIHFHFARANPHVNVLRESKRAMIAFMGPHAYMSPKVYPDLKRVPTWNYIAVHAYGDVVELEGHDAKDSLLKSLIEIHEPPYAQQWRDLDADFQNTMLNAIAAFRLDVTQLESKFKLNQHRKEAIAAMKSTYANGNDNERDLAKWMERLGL
jgi:transcriptional regulator